MTTATKKRTSRPKAKTGITLVPEAATPPETRHADYAIPPAFLSPVATSLEMVESLAAVQTRNETLDYGAPLSHCEITASVSSSAKEPDGYVTLIARFPFLVMPGADPLTPIEACVIPIEALPHLAEGLASMYKQIKSKPGFGGPR